MKAATGTERCLRMDDVLDDVDTPADSGGSRRFQPTTTQTCTRQSCAHDTATGENTMNRTLVIAAWASGLMLLASGGCASTPLPPTDAFQAADIAITNADQDKAAEFAPVELKSARERIVAARAAVGRDPEPRDIERARQLANEAQADAELASARTRSARAEAVNAELRKNIETLKLELQRKSGAPT